MIKKTAMLAGVMILAFGIAFATSTPDITTTDNKHATAITGTVTDANTGDAISDAEIVLGDTETKATTDEYGSFTIEEVEPGAYTLTVSADGYENTETEVDVAEDGANVAVELTPEWEE